MKLLILCITVIFCLSSCDEQSSTSSYLNSSTSQDWHERLNNEPGKTCPDPLSVDEVFFSICMGKDLPSKYLGTTSPAVSRTLNATGESNLNITGTINGGEFKCEFHWYEKKFQELKEDILDRMDNRQKSFIRFTVPVMGYNNTELSMHKKEGILTWVWVFTKYDYMLHYPHNFIKISLATMGIITEDWALDYNNSIVPVSLRGLSFDIDDDYYEHEANVGWCDPECVKAYNSCGIGQAEIRELMSATIPGKSEEWEWVCLQLPYDEHIHAVTGSQPSFVSPDVVYYVMFLRKLLLVERPFLGIPRKKRTFIHYHCYKGSDLSVTKRKEVLEKYYIILFIAFVLWLYAPLLIHYFPSSSKKSTLTTAIKTPPEMFPSHKSPNYFGRCLKSILCFYAPKNSARFWICARRVLFLTLIWLSSFHIFFVPYYRGFAIAIAAVLTLVMLCPFYISEHINPDVKFVFMGREVPSHLVHIDPDVVEYQLLAAVMQERIYILLDGEFWGNVHDHFSTTLANFTWTGPNLLYTVFKCVFNVVSLSLLIIRAILSTLCYLIPLPFFVKELGDAVIKMTHTFHQQSPSIINKVTSTIQGFLLFCTLFYCLVVVFFWCYAIMEVSLFTLMGGAMLPTMAFPYMVLAGSIARAIYSLVHSLHEEYEAIISNIISILNSERKVLSKREFDPAIDEVVEIEKKEDTVIPSSYSITVTIGKDKKEHVLMKSSVVATFVSTKLYESVVEACHPLMQQVVFIVLQIVVMLFYAGIVLWVKNVYHLEPKVNQIFNLVTNLSVTFVPRLLRYLAYKSYFGQDTAVVQKQKVYFAIIDHITKL